MGIHIRTSPNSGVSMPFWLAAVALPIYWSVVACWWIVFWSFRVGVLASIWVVRFVAASLARRPETRRHTLNRNGEPKETG